MNSGVGDAIDLAWKLAARCRAGAARTAALLRDRAPPDRRPQCRRIPLCHHRPAQMARHVATRYSRRNTGRRRPRRACRVADVEQRKSNEMIGAELGYRYVNSPIICNVRAARNSCSATISRPPGRAPACRMSGSTTARRAGPHPRRLYDPEARPAAKPMRADWKQPSAAHGAPVKVLDVPDQIARDIYSTIWCSAPRHARRMARQCRAGRCRRGRGGRDRARVIQAASRGEDYSPRGMIGGSRREKNGFAS